MDSAVNRSTRLAVPAPESLSDAGHSLLSVVVENSSPPGWSARGPHHLQSGRGLFTMAEAKGQRKPGQDRLEFFVLELRRARDYSARRGRP